MKKLFQVAEAGQILPSRESGNSIDVCDLFVALAGSEDPERNDAVCKVCLCKLLTEGYRSNCDSDSLAENRGTRLGDKMSCRTNPYQMSGYGCCTLGMEI